MRASDTEDNVEPDWQTTLHEYTRTVKILKSENLDLKVGRKSLLVVHSQILTVLFTSKQKEASYSRFWTRR